jgi:hypothetical protein
VVKRFIIYYSPPVVPHIKWIHPYNIYSTLKWLTVTLPFSWSPSAFHMFHHMQVWLWHSAPRNMESSFSFADMDTATRCFPCISHWKHSHLGDSSEGSGGHMIAENTNKHQWCMFFIRG